VQFIRQSRRKRVAASVIPSRITTLRGNILAALSVPTVPRLLLALVRRRGKWQMRYVDEGGSHWFRASEDLSYQTISSVAATRCG